ncbi:hypothetical protein PAECIP111893_02628 [Paenibacillus plantiphilus]|uniref:Polysaccharide pyruvyl transferase domain-containing protein n=1 Tax=Paenibacillus plantiphilus TaxID=2905650 RepID=A0ABM9C8G9_9BACL|nr:polysaccharide pyruvyl transferase family protein [Paenibacillus plantiphilus]CAH1206835.1 hypothetical protein PAECIP111893_02628 [Paenibacillus plantiphilus]
MTTVLLAGVPKSPNLGDGLIARTLTHLIQMHGPHEVIHFDLTRGRFTGDSSNEEGERDPASYRLNGDGLKKRATPDSLRMAKAYWIHRRNHSRINGELRKMVAQCDVVMIGGGHLFIDTYLTFPLAVRRVAAEAARQRKPLHIMLVGARGPWSTPAKAWFRSVCRYAATIAVRDEESRDYLLSVDASLSAKIIALSDPALFTEETFASIVQSQPLMGSNNAAAYAAAGSGSPQIAATSVIAAPRAAAESVASIGVNAPSRTAAEVVSSVGVIAAPRTAAVSAASVGLIEPPRTAAGHTSSVGLLDPPEQPSLARIIGLGIMDPNEMRRSTELRWDREQCAEWWRTTAELLADKGYEVRVFTNGADTDNAFVEQMVKPRCKDIPNVSFYSYPTTVNGLITQIADCDAVIAQRLHACLPAISMRKPTYGIIWDKKLSSIFRDLNLAHHLINFNHPAVESVAGMRLDEKPPARSLQTMMDKKEQLYKHIGSLLP